MSDLTLKPLISGEHSSANQWCLNLWKSVGMLFASAGLFLPGLWSSMFAWPYPYHALYGNLINVLGLYPPDTVDWFQKINLNMTSENYKVTYDKTTRWIYLDPLEKHETTVIFLHGVWSRGDKYFNLAANQALFPKTARIILPQAQFHPVGNFNGLDVASWFDIMALPDTDSWISWIFNKGIKYDDLAA